jgi:hypothetical protein
MAPSHSIGHDGNGLYLSSIKVLLKSVLILNEPGFIYVPAIEDLYDPIRKDQLSKGCEFFKREITETWLFEKSREIRLGIIDQSA